MFSHGFPTRAKYDPNKPHQSTTDTPQKLLRSAGENHHDSS